jgi:hypothetical protein
MNTKLKNCPFCGGEAKLIPTWSDCVPFRGEEFHFVVKCASCGFSVDDNDGDTGRESAIYAWNKYVGHVHDIQGKRFICSEDIKNGIYRFVVTETNELAAEYMGCEDCDHVCKPDMLLIPERSGREPMSAEYDELRCWEAGSNPPDGCYMIARRLITNLDGSKILVPLDEEVCGSITLQSLFSHGRSLYGPIPEPEESTMTDYREARQIGICTAPDALTFSKCLRYKPYAKHNVWCAYNVFIKAVGHICEAPELEA